MSKVQKRPSELSVSAPTRTALLQIALLKPGNMFVSIQPLDRCSYPGFLERWDYVAFSRRRRQWLCKLTCSLHTTFRFPCLVMFCTERKSKRDLHGLPMYFLWFASRYRISQVTFLPLRACLLVPCWQRPIFLLLYFSSRRPNNYKSSALTVPPRVLLFFFTGTWVYDAEGNNQDKFRGTSR